jgi:hypothetical protein
VTSFEKQFMEDFYFKFVIYYFIQHGFICRPKDSTVPEDVEIEPRAGDFDIGSQTLQAPD